MDPYESLPHCHKEIRIMVIERKALSDSVFMKLETLCNCISKDQTRRMLQVIKLHIEKGRKLLIATDGRCMGVYDVTQSKIPEIQLAKRCKFFRVETFNHSRIVLSEEVLSPTQPFPIWQRVDPDLSQYTDIGNFPSATFETRYSHLLYTLCLKGTMPISLTLYDKIKRLDTPSCILVHKTENLKAIVFLWDNDFRWVVMPFAVDMLALRKKAEAVA